MSRLTQRKGLTPPQQDRDDVNDAGAAGLQSNHRQFWLSKSVGMRCSLRRLVNLVLTIILVTLSLQFIWGFQYMAKTEPNQMDTETLMKNALVEKKSDSMPSVVQANPCNITEREAISALKRATTEECKNEMTNLVCRIQKNAFYPASLPRYCPTEIDAAKEGSRLGCFTDTLNNRILSGHSIKRLENNTPEKCIQLCQDAGFLYAGVQYGIECFCGNSQPTKSISVDDKECDTSCPGDATKKCGGFLKMDVFHTGLDIPVPPREGEKGGMATDVNVVFLLSLNGRAVRQVMRLMKRLNGTGSYFYIHVDARQDYMAREVADMTVGWSNVRIASRRFSTIWGGSSLLTMLLSSIRELLHMTDWQWDFVLNLSESDYLVKDRSELFQFLAANKDKNFVKSHGRDPDSFIRKQGLDKTFLQCENRMWRLGPRKLPYGIQIDGGSDWVCLNREFATYFTHSSDELVTGLISVFNYTLLPAESFFHTLLKNSKLCHTYINSNLHLTNWKRKQGCKCQYRAIVDWCGCSPNVILSEDWEKLTSTAEKQIFFARKFEPYLDNAVLNRLDTWRSMAMEDGEDEAFHDFWQNIYHYRDEHPLPPVHFNLTMFSLARLAVGTLTLGDDRHLLLDRIHPEEVHVHTHPQETNSILVLFSTSAVGANGPNPTLTLEAKVTRLRQTAHATNVKSRIVGLEVGTEFDPKELVFRNLLGSIGVDSKPSLRVEFSAGKARDGYEFGWFNPLGNLTAVQEHVVNTTATVENLEPTLGGALLPGTWTVVAAKKGGGLVAKHQFLVTPKSSSSFDEWENVLPQPSTSYLIEKLSKMYSLTQQEILQRHKYAERSFSERIDHNVDNFYKVTGLCIHGHEAASELTVKFAQCRTTKWSSKFPDRKSLWNL